MTFTFGDILNRICRHEHVLPSGSVNCAADYTTPFRLARTLRKQLEHQNSPFRSSLPQPDERNFGSKKRVVVLFARGKVPV
jgi:hypothetical protein